ncbi:MAG: UvrD-helicase domain-containing protein [Bacteroidota bacterium]|nr:UvrD-helicase domain-containing protein [Bacteroidota bacterium]
MGNSNFTIYSSSAGSGKTYTLSLNYLALSLKGDDFGYTDYYRKILAVTFTNKAAAEMKERVLFYFQELSDERDTDNILAWLKTETGLNNVEIFKRSRIIHQHILHHYSDLSISTIDKFTYKIVRTFARDLGLSYNFELEMDDYKIIQPVVALLLEKLEKSGGDLTNALVNFALQKTEDGKSSNIERDLEEFAKQLFRENAVDFLDRNSLSVKQFIRFKDDLYKRQNQLEQKVQLLSQKATNFLNQYGFTKAHFNNGAFYKHFTENILNKDTKKWIPSDALLRYIKNDEWYAKSKSDEIKKLVDFHLKDLQQFINELLDLLKPYLSNKAVLQHIYSIAVLNEMIQEVNAYKKAKNIQQISSFNKQIHDVVVVQPSAFIYERIGERYHHFLIDEFQDTSLLQWQNMLPLITDAIDAGKSLVVGDGKQSIYRWRAAEVKQFLQLPKIYNGEKLHFKTDWENKLGYHEETKNLEKNYRSQQEIIKFNNEFFEQLKNLLSPNLQAIYKAQKQEYEHAEKGGYVHIELFGDKENDANELILKKILSEIKKLVNENNYALRDIAILCNSRKSVALTAQYLAKNNIGVISNEGLLLHSSEQIKVLISALYFLQNQNDKVAKASILSYLHQGVLKTKKLDELHDSVHENQSFLALLKTGGISFPISKLTELPLFELCQKLIRNLKLWEDIYVQFFLDVVLKYAEKNSSSVSEFLLWWEEVKTKETIVVPKETNAVQVMTIHKAKGLAFNVVMIPFNWEDTSNKNKIWVDTSKQYKKLKSALINSSKILEWTFFSAEHQQEKELLLLDNLNKLYVAMTRPKERLYIFSKSFPDKIVDDFDSKGKLHNFLHHFSSAYPIVKGDEKELHQKRKDETIHSFLVKNQNKNRWQEVISLKHSAEKIWDVEKHQESVQWGKLLHLALSQINHITDADEIIEGLFAKGKCNKSQYNKLKRQIPILLKSEQIAKYFTPNYKVKTESEILVETGETYIPDRLVFDGEKVTVIDYKTGEQDSKHKTQINNYANTLKQMGYKVIATELIYTKVILKA